MHVCWSACGRSDQSHNLLQVGQVFHPEQDRIVSVRECARAQVRCQVIPVTRLVLKHGGDRNAGGKLLSAECLFPGWDSDMIHLYSMGCLTASLFTPA